MSLQFMEDSKFQLLTLSLPHIMSRTFQFKSLLFFNKFSSSDVYMFAVFLFAIKMHFLFIM